MSVQLVLTIVRSLSVCLRAGLAVLLCDFASSTEFGSTISISALVSAAEPQGGVQASLENVLQTWRAGDLQGAHRSLSDLIAAGSRDPRIWYFRGVISEQLGNDGTEDFQVAAARETATSSSRLVNTALEPIQGPLRTRIEAIRESSRLAIKPDPVAARNLSLFRDAMTARTAGNSAEALQKLSAAIDGGTRDPRVFYMRGVLLAQKGDTENARLMFQQGLRQETSAADVRAVAECLHDVQGDIRRLIEEQVWIEDGGQRITRQSNQQKIFQQEAELFAQLRIADAGRKNLLLAQAEQAQRDRERAAAERILEEELREQQAAARPRTVPSSDEPVIADAAPSPRSTPAQSPAPAANPFGITPAEAPDASTSAPAAVANPFLAGNQPATGSSSRGTTSALDFSWLAPNSELVVYARPADLTGSRFMSPLMQLPQVQQGLQTMIDQAGFSISDTESVVFGMGDVMAAITGAAMAGGADPNQMAQQFMSNPSALSVVRTSRDIDFPAIALARNAPEVTHGGKSYYLMDDGNPMTPETAVYVVDSRTFLSATEPAMRAALDRGPGNSSNPQFGFVSTDSHLVLAFSSPALAPMSGSLPAPPNAPPFVQELINAVRGQVNGVAVTLRTTADLNLQVQLSLNDPTAGSGGLNALQGGVTMLQQMYPIMKAQVPAQLQPVTDATVQSVRAEFSEPLLSFSLTVPGRLITILQESPELLGPFMMPGAIGPSSNGFDAPPNAFPSNGVQPNPPGITPPANPSEGFGFPGETAPPQN